jgi:hypothetical protein
MASNKPLSKPMAVISTMLLSVMTIRSFIRMNFWWGHSNPPFAIGSGISALITGSIALTFILSFFASEAGFITRFVSRESPLLPTTVGLVLAAAGIYGMLVLIDEEYVAFEWPFYAAVFGAGVYVLRRTFSVED